MANTSRIVPGAGQDNTGRNFGKDLQTPAYAAIVNIQTTQFDTILMPANITGAMTINVGVGTVASGTPGTPGYVAATAPYIGDQLQVVLSSTPGATVTLGTGTACSSYTSIVAATKINSISFIFNGTAWVEVGRSAGA